MTENPSPKILVADDDELIREILSEALSSQYEVEIACNGKEAVEIGSWFKPDMALLDYDMPVMNGFEAMKKLHALFPGLPVIFISGHSEQMHLQALVVSGAVGYFKKPFILKNVLDCVAQTLSFSNPGLAKPGEADKQLKPSSSKAEIQQETIDRLTRVAEYRDGEAHCKRVGLYARLLAEQCGLTDDKCKLIQKAAEIHDIGYVGVADAILDKPGPLDTVEWGQIQRHPSIGADILSGGDSPEYKLCAEAIFTHHEKYDGSGYPNGLAGKEIPLSGRIISLANVFDILTTERPYKKAWSIDKAFQEIGNQRGAHFDPEIVDNFIEIREQITEIHTRFKN